MHGSRAAELLGEGEIVVPVEIEEARRVTEAFDDLQVGLRRHDHEHAEGQRNQQPDRPRTAAALAWRICAA